MVAILPMDPGLFLPLSPSAMMRHPRSEKPVRAPILPCVLALLKAPIAAAFLAVYCMLASASERRKQCRRVRHDNEQSSALLAPNEWARHRERAGRKRAHELGAI
jgi:hypothetical protein